MSEQQEEFQTITLEVRNQASIFDGLKRFTTAEEISGFRCSACNQAVDITRQTVINKQPNYLFLHLQRLVFDFETLQNTKINTKVSFPNILNIKPYTKGEIFKDKKDLLERAKREALQ
jgi:ubiquitin C-terminal hydrolase